MTTLGPIKLGAYALLVTLLLTVNTVNSQDKCRSGCHGIKPHTFKYVDGTTYKYNLDGHIDVSLSTVEGQTSSTKIKGTVLLTQQADCNQVLRLQNVQVIGADGKKHSNIPNIEKPVRINFHDGHVEDLICAEPEDTQVSLNIKRAVASMFQANIKKHYETDVFGVCPTDVSTRKEGGLFVIQKSKDLNKCSHREAVKQDFFATSFNLHSDIKTSPILNSDYFSEQKLKNGILDQATITENYLYVPFSAGKNGAKATVTTKLHFVGTSKDAAQEKCNVAKPILFENPHTVLSDKSNVNVILGAVKDAVKSVGNLVSMHTADKFLNLVRIMRASKRDDLLSVYNQVNAGTAGDKEVSKKVFLDALFRAGTGDSIEVTIQLLKNKPLTPVEQNLVYLGLSFARHVTPGSLKAATSLLDQQHVPREAYLGIGALAGHYCKTHSCEHEEALNSLTQKLLAKLGNGKANNRVKEDEIISILKAFGNMHHLSNNLVPKIVAIAQDKKSSNRLRVAALEALQSDACQDKVRDSVIGILKDIQQDSEIRIKAYLAAVQCPNGKVAAAIKNLLQSEPSYQVGGFIVSHLRNLKASANPDKEYAKQQLGLISTNKNYPFDFRKYSYNQEFSYSFDALGLGTSTESNVIYSQNSFLPRSTSWNMTAQIFGHTVNFLEIDTRQENFDKLLEHYFGPLGLLNKYEGDELGEKFGKEFNKIRQKFDSRMSNLLRSKRDVTKSEIDTVNKQVQIKSNDLNNDLDLDLSIKLLGSELLFFTLNDDIKKFTPEVIIDKFFDQVHNSFDKLKSFEHTFRTNGIFLEAELSYPTSTGFPLKISAEGVSSLQLEAKGAIDMRSIVNFKNNVFKLSLIPSGNVQINGRLTVDAYFLESGLKTMTNLYTATGSGLECEFFHNGKGFDTKLSFPLKKHELISATHDVVFHNRELGLQETNVPLKFAGTKPFQLCFDHLSQVTGLTFCLDLLRPNVAGAGLQHPVLPFPLDGNSKFTLTVENEDLSFIHMKLQNDFNEKEGVDFLLETLSNNKQVKARISAELHTRPEMYVKLGLQSPIRSSEIEGRINNNDHEKSISVRATDMNNKYFGKAGVSITGSGNKFIYKPIFDYNLPNVQPGLVKVDGQIVVDKNGYDVKYTFKDVKVTAHNQKTYTIDGTVGREGHDTHFANVKLTDGKYSASIDGRLKFNGKDLKVNADFKNSINPQANFNLKYELESSSNGYDSKLQVIHGADLNSKLHVFKLENKLHVDRSVNYIYATKNHLSYPLLQIKGKFDAKVMPREIEYDISLSNDKHSYGSELYFGYDMKTKGDYNIKFGAEGFKNKMEVKMQRVISGETSKVNNYLEHNGKKYELNGEIKHHSKAKDINIGADLVLKIAGKPHPYKLKHGLILNPNELDTLLKVTVGEKPIIDIFLKHHKGGNANGNVKVDIKDLIKANGQLKATKGKGNANIVVEFVKSGNKIKSESQFTIADPTYNFDITFYPYFEKDNNKKIVLSTHNKVTGKSVDSKSTFDIFGQKLESNFKGSKDGDIDNGKLNGEIELTLPNDMYFAGKVDRQVRTVDNVINGHRYLQLEKRDNKNAPGMKMTYRGEAKNTNLKEYIYDITEQVTFENGNGKNFVVDTVYKKNKEGGKNTILAQGKISGNALQHPIELEVNAAYQDKAGNYKINGKFGPKATLGVDRTYNYNREGGLYEDVYALEVHTPSTKFSVLKLKYNAYLAMPKNGNEVDFKGSTSVFVDDDGSAPDATIDIRSDWDLKVKQHQGQFKGTVHFQKLDPVTIALGYSHHEDKAATRCKCDFSLEYAKGKFVKLDGDLARPNKNEAILDVNMESSHEKAKNLKFHIQGKSSDDNKHFTTNGKFTLNEKEYTFNTDLVTSRITPSFSYQIKRPDGKMHKFLAKVTKSSPKEFAGELQVTCPRTNFDFNGKVDSKFESVDDFFIKLNANSAALKWDKIVAEASSKGSKGDKKVQFTVTSAGKNVLSGSTNYKTSDEGGKFILEGSGNVKVKDQSQSANFKFTRQNLVIEKQGEDGIELSFDASLGNKAIDAEFKVSNRHVRLLNSYCEEKKQCAHFEVDSKLNKVAEYEYNHVLEINIDLRKLGLSHEFGLKSVTDKKNNLLDHTVDVHFQNQENSKYQYSVYVHPNEAGVSLTTPKRVISVESKLESMEKTRLTGYVYAYLDKKHQPNKKLAFHFDLTIDDGKNPLVDQVKLVTKLSAPGLAKDLTMSYDCNADYRKDLGNCEIVIDVFANPNQKIIISSKSQYHKDEQNGYGFSETVTAKSAGLGINYVQEEEFYFKPADKSIVLKETYEFTSGGKKYVSGGEFNANTQQAHAFYKILNRELMNVNSKYQLNKDSQIIDTSVSIYGIPPFAVHTEFANYNTFHENIYYVSNPKDKLSVHAAVIIGQIADYRVEIHKGGKKLNLLHSSIQLDESNFLKSDFGIDYNNIKNHLIAPLKEKVNVFITTQQELSNDITKDAGQITNQIGEKLKNSMPNVSNAQHYYENEFDKIKEEFIADKTIQKMAEFLKTVFGAVWQTFIEVFVRVNVFLEKLAKVVQGNFAKLFESIKNDIIPMIKARVDQLITAAGQIFEKVTDIIFLVLGKISQFLEQHKEQLKQMSTIVTQTSHEIAQAIGKMIQGIQMTLAANIRAIIEEFKALPVYKDVEEKYKEYFKNFQVNEVVGNAYKEFETTVKRIIPEWEKIVGSFSDYNVRPTSLDYLFKLPKHIALRLSPISYIINGEFPSITEFFRTVTFNPELWIPPFQIQGIIAQGQHIFTFDGKHLTFPGKCNYLLVRDAFNGNFSVFGTYTDGILTAITVSDKENVATVKKDGKLLFNNAAHEYPARKDNLEVFRLYDTVNIVSKAGIRITCLNDLEGCVFLISGFYHGQLRGLLGNGNNEAYDDFVLPNGKIVTSESDFGNAYKASPNCPLVKTVDHNHHTHTEQCNKYFGGESTLMLCYPFVNPDNFRTACDHGVSAGVPRSEAAAVGSYVAACHLRGINIPLPEEFLKCKNGVTERQIGDSFSVKTPTKMTDVIIAIDQIKENEVIYKDLVHPLVQQLNSELHAKGISDINYHVIGYGGDYEDYPSHYTVGSKIVTKDKLPEIKFTEKEKDKYLLTGWVVLDNIFNGFINIITDLEIAFGFDPQSEAYHEAMKYPFRVEASKVVIAVTGKPCKYRHFSMLQYIRALLSLDKSINLNIITPFSDCTKDEKPAKNIIGFNQYGAFTMEKGKKDANAELLKEIKYTDLCVQFTKNVGGNVFISDNFINAKGNHAKQFIQTVSHNIVEQVTSKELGLDCECKRVSSVKAKNVCKIASVKDKHKRSK